MKTHAGRTPEQEREFNRIRCLRWRKQNPQTYNKACKKYRDGNREKIRAWDRLRYLRDKKKRNALSKKWYTRKGKEAHRRYYRNNRYKADSANLKWKKEHLAHWRAYAAAWRRKAYRLHKEKFRERNRLYLAVYRGRKRAAGGSFTRQQWLELLEKQAYKCARCAAVKKLTVDHIVPVSKGGTGYIWNIQALCLSCNSSKGARQFA